MACPGGGQTQTSPSPYSITEVTLWDCSSGLCQAPLTPSVTPALCLASQIRFFS